MLLEEMIRQQNLKVAFETAQRLSDAQDFLPLGRRGIYPVSPQYRMPASHTVAEKLR